jgi:hypothetical protein
MPVSRRPRAEARWLRRSASPARYLTQQDERLRTAARRESRDAALIGYSCRRDSGFQASHISACPTSSYQTAKTARSRSVASQSGMVGTTPTGDPQHEGR